MHYKSGKKDRVFNNEASVVSIDAGCDIHIAKNVIRFRNGLKKAVPGKKVWTDPKTGLPLTVEQWTGPALKRYNKVCHNLRQCPETPECEPEDTYFDAQIMGMGMTTGGALVTIHEREIHAKYVEDSAYMFED